jgi:ribosomal protein L11 methyltransferase
MRVSAAALETVSVDVPEAALEAFEAALGSVCATVGFFRDPAGARWFVEGVKPVGEGDAALTAALALATALTGVEAVPRRTAIPADGWLARTRAAFPQQLIGRRFAVRGTHLSGPAPAGRITLTLDAALAFGSGEHGSTRGCLRALERVARRRPRRILDLGTGSGILAMAAAQLLHRRVLATDIEPWSVRVARGNAVLNRIGPMLRCWRADGWRDRAVRASGPYDLVLANILARPLCLMAWPLAAHLAPGGTAILAGLLVGQARQVLVAHRRRGLRLEAVISEGPWTALVLRAGCSTGRGSAAHGVHASIHDFACGVKSSRGCRPAPA